ncbi:MAG: hypothetical protein ACRD3M_05910 [Thermoanaerobaculia bacterium]
MLADEFETKELAPIEAHPDLWVVVHARLSSQTQVTSDSPAWGYDWGACAAAYDPVEYQVPVGTLPRPAPPAPA